MTVERTPEYLNGLLRELCALPRETEWVEFKVNLDDPQEIGEYISALSNSAALYGKAAAYLVWGVKDDTHEIVGTTFAPRIIKKGNEEFENWLLRLLTPRIHFYFYELTTDAGSIVMLEITRASNKPVQFHGQEFIRVGSYKKKLKDFPEKERELWRVFDQVPFEDLPAAEHVFDEDVLKLLDYPAYFDLLELGLPADRKSILQRLSDDDMISACEAGGWDITNLGAILFAKKLDTFKHLKRKAVRVIVYKGNGRHETIKEQDGTKGYASGFEGLIGFINNLLPVNEVIGKALRKKVPLYPEIAVRELVANAIIHQDFFIRGAGPMIEIFSDRMEVTNPGSPLVKTERLLDSPPKSRNEALASFMRRIGICEERGSGVDKVVFQTELYQLPAPSFEVIDDNTKVVLFADRALAKMDKTDRIRACYLHACLRYVNRDYMTNTSIRDRFGITPSNKAIASRYIREAVEAKAVKPYDEDAAPKLKKYVPYWA